ncbi:MAG: BolA family transcriptional regulator [Gammaproteobacteria bacterium]|nr:MAG: BolA family transcriptional regulator [Gammaproteobacteria bacterium]
MTMERTAMIRERLTRALQPLELEIIDESAKHAGHAGAASGGGHFIVSIVSPVFEDKTLIQRHRLVYDAVGDIMHSEIHALSINAKTPQET